MTWWIAIVLTGCCADTYEIVADRTGQPAAEVESRLPGAATTTDTGELSMHELLPGFQASLRSQGPRSYVLRVPARVDGTFTGELDIVNATDPAETVPVTLTLTGVSIVEVCMDPDQNDYGTGRCGFSFVGTVAFAGTTASLVDVSATWVMSQIAVVTMGTPDC